MAIEKIAVIGLGAMGNSLAGLSLKAGYKVTGYDIDPRQVNKLVKQGIKPTKSAATAAKNNDLIILSLPNWSIVETVVEGKNGLLKTLQKGQIVVDTSTVPPHETKTMAAKLAKKGIEWMDVPISGAANQARVGNMVFMAGGKKSVFKKVKPVLDNIGKKTVYVGKNGDAALLKLVVNQTLFLNQAAAVEGLTLGLKAGLDPDVMLDVLTSGAAGSDLLSARGEDMLKGNFKPKGALWIAIKDLGMALESARQHGVVLPIAGLYQQMMLGARYDGWDDSDATVVMKTYAQMAGIKKNAGSTSRRKKKK